MGQYFEKSSSIAQKSSNEGKHVEVRNNLIQQKESKQIQKNENKQIVHIAWNFDIEVETGSERNLQSFRKQLLDFQENVKAVGHHQQYQVKCFNQSSCKYVQNHVLQIMSPKTQNVIVIELRKNRINSNGIELLRSHNFTVLSDLTLDDCELDSKCAQLIQKWKMPNLFKLSLQQNNIDDYGIVSISKGKWPKLEYLHLSMLAFIIGHNPFTSKGFSSIGSALWKNIKCLYFFNFYKIDLSDGIENIGELFKFPKLEQLWLCNYIMIKGIQKYRNQI